jgi:hypothetical protein
VHSYKPGDSVDESCLDKGRAGVLISLNIIADIFLLCLSVTSVCKSDF